MGDNLPSSATAVPSESTLNFLAPEILQNIFYFTTSTTFFQLIQVNRKFFEVASESRELILHHLRHVPGIKLGLDDRTVSTSDLFLIFRQRAASHLYGVNFTAEYRNLEPLHGIFDPRASCLTREIDGCDSCVVFKNSLRVKCNSHNNPIYGETIESPYGDGRAKIMQVVQKTSCISILYAWEPPQKDAAEDTSHLEPITPVIIEDTDTYRARPDNRDDIRYCHRRGSRRFSETSPRIRYHLLHYDSCLSERPIFFHIPTHRSLYGIRLAPVHLAVHNRLQCAILWDLPNSVLPTPNATVCLYMAEHLPRHEPGSYVVWVIYPFDHAAPHRRNGGLDDVTRSASPGSESEDEKGSNSTAMVYTHTNANQTISSRGRTRDFDSDLRFLYFPLKPRSISFFKEGRRLSLYAPGSTTPFTTLLANEALRNRYHSSSSSQIYHSTTWRSRCRRVRRTNHTSVHGHHFRLSLPFFSKHETISRPTPQHQDPDEDDVVVGNECMDNMLCIGTARSPSISIPIGGEGVSGPGPEILAIVQIRERRSYDDCSHSRTMDDLPAGLPQPPRERHRRSTTTNLHAGQDSDVTEVVNLPANDANNTINDDHDHSEPEMEIFSDSDTDDMDFGRLGGIDIRVVARLWGWNAHNTSLTGLETVSVSPSGARIAVAHWDKVLVYALNPAALCEDLWRNANDSDVDSSQGGSDSNNDSDSDNGTENGDGDGSTISIVEDEFGPGDPPIDNSVEMSSEVGADGLPQHPTSSLQPPMPLANTVLQGSTPAMPNPPASITSARSTSPFNLVNYYPHVFDKNLSRSIALLRPIVLKMDAGAVVRKMSWDKRKPAREDEDKSGSEDDEVAAQEPASAEQENGKAGERAVKVNDQDKGAEKLQVNGSESDAPTTPQAADCDSGQEGVVVSANSGIVDSPRQLQGSSTSPPALPIDVTPESPVGKPTEQPTSSTLEDLPPAPFSDMKLTGQIKHIGRPPEYYNFPTKIVLPPPPTSSIPPSLADFESAVDKIDKNQAHETESFVKNEPVKAEEAERADQVRSESLAPERKTPVIATAQAEREPMEESEAEPEPRRKVKRKPSKRNTENELIVMTDRGIQVWDLSVWGKGRRLREELLGGDILQ